MSNDTEQARDEHLIAAMSVVLASGYAIENQAGDARIERLVDGQTSVLTLERSKPGYVVPIPRPTREHFDDVREAVRYYLDAVDG